MNKEKAISFIKSNSSEGLVYDRFHEVIDKPLVWTEKALQAIEIASELFDVAHRLSEMEKNETWHYLTKLGYRTALAELEEKGIVKNSSL